jgi:hypothetical protein
VSPSQARVLPPGPAKIKAWRPVLAVPYHGQIGNSGYDGNRRNARDLYWYYEERGAPDITDVRRFTPGCLVFYRRPGGADTFGHVAIHAATVPTMSRHGAMIEVGPLAFETGGGRTDTDSPWRALLESARIRLTATDQHPLIAFVAKDPFILLG